MTIQKKAESSPSSDKMQDLAINVSNLRYCYPKSTVDTLSIDQWRVAKGERIFLQGASGSGKSTLLQLHCGLRVGLGELSIAGTCISTLSQAKRDRFRVQHMGMVFQQFNLIPYLSALENVTLAAGLARLHKSVAANAQRLLDQVGLQQSVWKQPASSLSIGQQQRVAIARTLINSPSLLLFDEPTSALDGNNQTRFMATLMQHLDQNPATTLVFVSHDLRLASYFDQAIEFCDLCSTPAVV